MSPTIVFFDTEFTNFKVFGKPKLISIGLVADDGQEFYAELMDTYELGDCSNFVIENILPLLTGGKVRMMKEQLANRLALWVSALGNDCFFQCDSIIHDWSFVLELFNENNCWPTNLQRECRGVEMQTNSQEKRYIRAMNEYWAKPGNSRHHALSDARAMLYAHKKSMK